MLSAFIILGLGTGGTVYTLNQLTNDRTGSALKVEQVNFEELVRGASGKVVKVTGTISNTGSTPAPLPGVSIVLRSAGGREVARWRYSSRKTRLAPGEKTHFMSAKPLDYTIVSSVEAQISED